MSSTETHDVLRLHALGGLSITDDGTPVTGTVARRRSLALLALVASSGDAGISDERALTLLWPDFDLARARNNLKQVAFTLRQALGRDAFIRTSTTLRLDPELFSVDRWDFERAIANHDAERAVDLYSGPFLAGFYISGLSDLERWVESERELLAHLYTGALTTLALGAEALGDYATAVEWWRKVVSEDRLTEISAQRLIRALTIAGDSAGALQHARVYKTLVAQELELQPSPAFEKLVEDIRAGVPISPNSQTARIVTPTHGVPSIVMAPVARRQLPTEVLIRSTPAATVSAPPVAANRVWTQPLEAARSMRRRRVWTTGERRVAGFTTRFTTAAVAFVVVALVAAFTVNRYGPQLGSAAEAGASSAVVAPFSVNAGTGSANLGAVVSELLAASLDGSMGLRALSIGASMKLADSGRILSSEVRRANAQRMAGKLGARFYVFGEVFENGDRLRLTAELRSRQDEAVLDRAVVEGSRTELFDLVDRVASQLLAGRIAGGRRDVVRLASTTTSSLSAAKAYFRAESAFAEGGFRAAIDEYEEAVQLDPTFALAHYGLANAAHMLGEDDRAGRSADEALEHAQQLPNRQKRLLAAFLARHRGDVTAAKRLYAQLTIDYPTDADAWLGLGETLFHLNPLEGQRAATAGQAFERAIALDSTHTGAYVHLARIAMLEHDETRARRLVARARRLAADPTIARFALHVLSLGVPPDDAAHDVGRRGSNGLPTSDAIALLTSNSSDDLRLFARRLGAGEARGYGLRLQALIESGHGRIAEAMALLDTCSASNHNLAVEARSRLAVLPFIPLELEEIDRIRTEVAVWRGDAHPPEAPLDSSAHTAAHPYLRLHRLGLISLRLNDTAAVTRIASQLNEMSEAVPATETPGRGLATSLRAHLAAALGKEGDALRLLESAAGSRVASATSLEAYDRLLRAQLLEQAGRDEEALGFYAQIGTRSPFELTLAWQAELGTARIHEKRGNPVVAARYYRKVAERLKDADAALRQVRDDAEQKALALTPTR